jgi:5S rRNA maturation endonuclease (ribonuclease M5)
MTMIMKKTRSSSHNQHKLKILSDKICDKIDDLLSYFDLEYKISGKFISMSCPIHGGDNCSAFNLYPEGERYRGNWKCRTHGCEEIFKSSILGFIRGVLSHQDYGWNKSGDKAYSFEEAIAFAEKFLNQRLSDIKVDKKHIEKNNFTNYVSVICETKKIETEQKKLPTRSQIRKLLNIPSAYFINRGYSSEILDKYDVGDCLADNKEMSNRIVVPIYDNSYEHMVGCTGRSLFEKCDTCKHYHNQKNNCPEDSEIWKYSKWRHSTDLKTQNYLYNYWFAQEYIKKSKAVIIVESPGNVWRLEESGINNSVALFGTNLSTHQRMLLDISGAMTLLLAMDNDEAGQKAAQSIITKCNKIYNIYQLKFDKPDIGEMSVEEIKSNIIPQIEKYNA